MSSFLNELENNVKVSPRELVFKRAQSSSATIIIKNCTSGVVYFETESSHNKVTVERNEFLLTRGDSIELKVSYDAFPIGVSRNDEEICLNVTTISPSRSIEKKVKVKFVENPEDGLRRNTRNCRRCCDIFNSSDAGTPRILSGCGHVICQACSQELMECSHIRCPFDGETTVVPYDNVKNLPKLNTSSRVERSGSHARTVRPVRAPPEPPHPPNPRVPRVAWASVRPSTGEPDLPDLPPPPPPHPTPRRHTVSATIPFSSPVLQHSESEPELEPDSSSTFAPCAEDRTHKAKFFCKDCKLDFCEKCFTSVHSHNSNRNHSKVPIAEKPIQLPNCPKHDYNPAEFICVNPECPIECKTICHTCLKGDHKDHRYEMLLEKLEKNQKVAFEMLQKLKLTRIEIQIAIISKKTVQLTYQQSHPSYHQKSQGINEDFETKKSEAIRNFEVFVQQEHQKLEEKTRKLDEMGSIINEMIQRVEGFLESRNVTDSLEDMAKLAEDIGREAEEEDGSDEPLDQRTFLFGDQLIEDNLLWYERIIGVGN